MLSWGEARGALCPAVRAVRTAVSGGTLSQVMGTVPSAAWLGNEVPPNFHSHQKAIAW